MSKLVAFIIVVLIILVSSAGLFWIERYLNRKLQGHDATKWRLRIGVVQCIMALILIWVTGHFRLSGLHKIVVIGGIGVFVLAGIGEIVIALLNSTAKKRISMD